MLNTTYRNKNRNIIKCYVVATGRATTLKKVKKITSMGEDMEETRTLIHCLWQYNILCHCATQFCEPQKRLT